jgi:hypothetical protein
VRQLDARREGHGAPVGGHDARARLELCVGRRRVVEPDRLQDPQHLVVDHGARGSLYGSAARSTASVRTGGRRRIVRSE